MESITYMNLVLTIIALGLLQISYRIARISENVHHTTHERGLPIRILVDGDARPVKVNMVDREGDEAPVRVFVVNQ